MRKLLSFVVILFFAVISGACINTFAVHELNEYAIKYMQSGDYHSAISRLESSIDLDGAIYESRYNLAVAYLRINECKKAYEQIVEAQKLISDEPAVFYTTGVAANCVADNIYEKKLSNGEVEKITYNDPIVAYKKAKEYVEYLNIANNAFDKYATLVPNAEDVNSVIQLMNENKDKIAQTQATYELKNESK